MNVLVTGSHGFAGRAVRAALVPLGHAVHGLGRAPGRTPGAGETYRSADLADPDAVRAAVAEAAPDLVFHLAAADGRGGEAAAREAATANPLATLNLMRALAERGRPVRVVHAGSSAQYGRVPAGHDPVTEETPLFPLGVYGWSKTASEAVALAWHGRGGIEVVAARPFNHVGPGEPPHLVCSAFARQIAAIEAGGEPVLRVGNLDAVRDLTDVRDLARGYLALADRGEPGTVYNLCSGRGTRVEEVLGLLLDRTEASIEVRADPARQRPAELARQVGSAARAERATGWKPEIPRRLKLDALLAEWRARTAAEGAPR